MRIDNTAFHFAGQEQIARENKLFKERNPKLAEQPVRVSISEEGHETYRNNVQAKQQASTFDELTRQRKALENVKYDKNPNKFEEDPEQHQKAKVIINEWQEQVAQIKSGTNPVQPAAGVDSTNESDSQSGGIRTASDIIREHSPETADKISGLVSDFWNTRDKSYLMQASRLALDWLNENYPKHPEWFGGENISKTDTNMEASGPLPDGRKSFVEIMQERTPDTAKQMQEFVSRFWNTGDKNFLEKASRLAIDWLNENYSKHPEWFNA